MMQCHKVDYEIIGNSMPMLEVELDPGETVVAEAGSMTSCASLTSWKSAVAAPPEVADAAIEITR